MPGERILVVEDKPAVARGLINGLEGEGFQVLWVETGNSALELVRQRDPHLILLDIRLPDISGFDVCGQLRKESRTLPIIMISAGEEEADKTLGMEFGANDCIVKPYCIRDVISRIRAQLRRSYGELASVSTSNRYRFGDIDVDFEQCRVLRDRELVLLTPTEFRILQYLIHHRNLPISRRTLIEAIWGVESDVESERTVDVHVRHLRIKLEEDPSKPRWIITVRGIGYRFIP